MLKQEHKDILNEYAKIKSEIKLLEEKADELNPEVMAIMDELEIEEISIEDKGKLVKAFRRTWKYIPEIEAIKKEYDTKKKEAEQTGIGAEYTEKPYLLFKQAKE